MSSGKPATPVAAGGASPAKSGDPKSADLNSGGIEEVRPPGRLELAWYGFARHLLMGPSRLLWRPRVVGIENLPQTTAFVLAPVHRSYIDAILAAYVVKRRIRFMAKSGVFSRPRLAKVFRSLGGFPVNRGTADREALHICERALAVGEPVVLFPEGKRAAGPVLAPLLNGPAFLALRANVPIVPLGIGGSEKAMPIGASWIHPKRCAMVVGKPIWPPVTSGSGRVPRRVVDDLTERLRSELQFLFDEAQSLAGP